MSPIVSFITKFIMLINRIIDSIDHRTSDIIRNSFYGLVTLLILTGIVIGSRMGRDSARIKSPPLTEYTNQSFEIDMNREKKNGEFRSMIDSEKIHDSRLPDPEKIRFRQLERLEPDVDRGIITGDRKFRETPGTYSDDRPVEGNYRPEKTDQGQVRPLKRDIQPFEGSEPSKKEKEALPELKKRSEFREKNTEKDPIIRTKPEKPELIIRDSGVVEQ